MSASESGSTCSSAFRDSGEPLEWRYRVSEKESAARELQDWQSYGLKRAIPGNEEIDEGSSTGAANLAQCCSCWVPVPRSSI